MQYRHNMPSENQDANYCCGQAGNENCSSGDIETAVNASFGFRIEAVEKRLDCAVEQFCSNHEADASRDQAPLHEIALENQCSGQSQSSEKEVDEETGMPANAELYPTERFPKLVAPPARLFSPRRSDIGRILIPRCTEHAVASAGGCLAECHLQPQCNNNQERFRALFRPSSFVQREVH
jgi:hypothetical protein